MNTTETRQAVAQDHADMGAISGIAEGVKGMVLAGVATRRMTRAQAIRAAVRGLVGASVALGVAVTVTDPGRN